MNRSVDEDLVGHRRVGPGRWVVGDVMTTDVVTADPDMPYRQLVQRLAQRAVSAVPVVDADRRVLGVVSEADLLTKLQFGGLEEHRRLLEGRRRRAGRVKAGADRAADLMTEPAVTIASTASIAAAARLMADTHVKRLPVLDHHGRLAGIVSRTDLLRVYQRSDDDLCAEVIGPVLHGTLGMAPGTLHVTAANGVISLGGAVDRSSTIPIVLRLVAGVPGVVDVVDHLSYHYNDRPEHHR